MEAAAAAAAAADGGSRGQRTGRRRTRSHEAPASPTPAAGEEQAGCRTDAAGCTHTTTVPAAVPASTGAAAMPDAGAGAAAGESTTPPARPPRDGRRITPLRSLRKRRRSDLHQPADSTTAADGAAAAASGMASPVGLLKCAATHNPAEAIGTRRRRSASRAGLRSDPPPFSARFARSNGCSRLVGAAPWRAPEHAPCPVCGILL